MWDSVEVVPLKKKIIILVQTPLPGSPRSPPLSQAPKAGLEDRRR